MRIQESLNTDPKQTKSKTVSQVKALTTKNQHTLKAGRDLSRFSLKAGVLKKRHLCKPGANKKGTVECIEIFFKNCKACPQNGTEHRRTAVPLRYYAVPIARIPKEMFYDLTLM